MKKHLAIMDKSTIEAILGGQKTIEARFSKTKIAPFAVVSTGDLVYMKPPGGEIVGQFRVKKVIFLDGCDKNFRFGTIIFIGDSERFITSPIKIKKSNQKGWVLLR